MHNQTNIIASFCQFLLSVSDLRIGEFYRPINSRGLATKTCWKCNLDILYDSRGRCDHQSAPQPEQDGGGHRELRVRGRGHPRQPLSVLVSL